MRLSDLREDLHKLANPQKAKTSQEYFMTGVGQYGYGDVFLGITVPQSRAIAQKYLDLSQKEIKELLESKTHEERLIALFLLVYNFQVGDEKKKKEIFDFYLLHTKYINNWDLVDASADKIIGAYLLDKKITILKSLAKSENIWERRVAIIATFALIRIHKKPDFTFKISEILLEDKHDLIQKAVGWMLRETGKACSQEIEEVFLRQHYKKMPRTMLRYAIERFPKNLRADYLRGRV